MKHSKPGFKNFIKTRVRKPFKIKDELIFQNDSGERFRDAGSAHTLIVLTAVILSALSALFVFKWTLYGYLLITFIGALLLLLHRHLRYFWTNFERLGEEGETIEDGVLYVKKAKKHSKAVEKLLGTVGLDEDEDEEEVLRYTGRQKALIALEGAIALAVVLASGFIFIATPYSRYYHRFAPEEQSIQMSGPVNTLQDAYKEARGYADGFCPGMDLTDCAVEWNNEEDHYIFQFENNRPDLFMDHAHMRAWISIDRNNNTLKAKNGFAPASYAPVSVPDPGMDMDTILEKVLKEINVSKDGLEYYRVGTHFWQVDPQITASPGIWAVQVRTLGEVEFSGGWYYVVDMESGTVNRIGNSVESQ